MSAIYSRIIGTGSYLPAKVLTNADLAGTVDTSDEWIQQRTGIRERHIAADNEKASDLALQASRRALEMAGITADQLSLIIVATTTPDMVFPSTACILQSKLGVKNMPAFDVQAVCSGFVYALNTADLYIKSGQYEYILVVGAEVYSRILDWSDRGTCVLFGDGAGAVVIGQSRDAGIGPVEWGSDADSRDAIQMNPSWIDVRDVETQLTKAGSKWPNISQEGQKVYRWAVFSMSKAAMKALESAGLTVNDIAAFIPHQANMRIIETMAKEMGMPDSVVIADDIRVNGNTSAASIPLAMDVLLDKHPELHGKLALLIGYGAGLVYAGQVVELPPKP